MKKTKRKSVRKKKATPKAKPGLLTTITTAAKTANGAWRIFDAVRFTLAIIEKITSWWD
jgi:hypothetical protein